MQFTYGYIQRLHILNLVPLYLIACYLKEFYNFDIIDEVTFGLMTSRLYAGFDQIQRHPHQYLITRENLMSKDTTFMTRETIPNRVINSSKQLLEKCQQRTLYERPT